MWTENIAVSDEKQLRVVDLIAALLTLDPSMPLMHFTCYDNHENRMFESNSKEFGLHLCEWHGDTVLATEYDYELHPAVSLVVRRVSDR